MSKTQFQKIYPLLKREMNIITEFTLINYKQELREDAELVFQSLQPQLEEWTENLLNREISTAELHYLIQSKKDEIELENLINSGISENEISFIKTSLLGLISNTITNYCLKSLLLDRQRYSEKETKENFGLGFFG